ncbi:chemotaxis protein CheW [Gorillibacterium sp. sgz5001074]|uniref:chemotaxis protein CheW n=1 Tax=Gorillibacterium sp. sgz5001074 TaxID=3446695 RepID=UPI003F672650
MTFFNGSRLEELEQEEEQYIEFEIGETPYALPIGCIHEIIRVESITVYPNKRNDVIGVINLRGRIIPVISLRSKLRMDVKKHDRATRIIVLQDGDLFGLLEDRVNRVTSFDELQPPPGVSGQDGSVQIEAIGMSGGKLVHILQAARILRNGS